MGGRARSRETSHIGWRSKHEESGRNAVTLAEALALALVAVLPSFINLASLRIFEADKALLLRAGAALIVAATLADWRRSAADVPWRSRAVIAVGALILVLAVAALVGVAPREALAGAYFKQHGVLTWLALAVVFLTLCASARRADGRARIAAALVIGSVCPAVYAVVQLAGVDPIAWGDAAPDRAGSTFGNAVLLGGYLAAVVPITAALALTQRVYVVVLLLQCAAIVASGSRGALAGLGAGAVALAALWAWHTGRRRIVIGAAAVIIIAVAGFALARPNAVEQLAGTGSGRVRVLIWSGIRDLIGAHPGRLVLGFGPESLRRVFPPHYSPEIARIEQREAMPDRAHNETLDMLVQAGALGVIAQLSLFAAALAAALRIPDPRLRGGITATLIVHIVEIQLGIATSASRLVFLACAALAVGFTCPVPGGPATFAKASAPKEGPPLRPSSMKPVTGRKKGHSSWRPVLAVAAGAIAAVPLFITPSRADVLAKRATALEKREQWNQAALVYGEALRLQPRVEPYLTGLARAHIGAATAATPGGPEGPPLRETELRETERTRRFQAARDALEKAAAVNPYDFDHARNLGSLHRNWARLLTGSARDDRLADADRQYARAAALAPALATTWVDWARVDGDRNQVDAAAQKITRALELNPDDAAAWLLRGHVLAVGGRLTEALAAYDRSLILRPGVAEALRARDIVRTQLQQSTRRP